MAKPNRRKSTRKGFPSAIKLPGNYISQQYFTGVYKHKILIGTPTLGDIRIEWHNATKGLVIPVNWSNSEQTPIGFLVDDAQNIIVKEALDRGFEWVFLLEDDVIPPVDLYIRLERYMSRDDKIPIVVGLYPLKSTEPTPFIFRGRGNGVFRDFKTGDKVWADGVPTGCTLIHSSILKVMYDQAEWYMIRANGVEHRVKRVFWTPRQVFSDAHLASYQKLVGTSDLFFCDQILERGILKKAGWPQFAKKRFPFLVDTAINCAHIERQGAAAGAQYIIGRTGYELQ